MSAPAAGLYRDGAESRVREIIAASNDRSSLSDELDQSGRTWAERYHLSIDRANIFRALEMRSTDRVLEIGSGCGAITRFLGETCGLVDGIEPDSERAQVAALRVADLRNTEIHVLELGEVPAIPYYDVVVITGVLEYVGLGGQDEAPYLEFLRMAAARLNSTGVLVCAIENVLGVKYLVGSPEDHTGRAFDGLEGYPSGSKARTFTRSRLEAMFGLAGLEPTVLHAFPDFKMAHAILSDRALVGAHAWLGKELPRFPSPDRADGVARTAREEAVWRNLVDGGEANRYGNSFLIVGRAPQAADRWPPEQVAAFFAPGRAARYRTETVVVGADTLTFQRRRAVEGLPDLGSLEHHPQSSTGLSGDRLDIKLEAMSWGELRTQLARWRELVLQNPGLIDLIPANIRVGSNDALQPFDQEWVDTTYTSGDILARGILALTQRVAVDRAVHWSELANLGARECAFILGNEVGLTIRGEWLDAAVEREARLSAAVRTGSLSGEAWRRTYDEEIAIYETNGLIPPRALQASRPVLIRAIGRIRRAGRVLLKGS